MKSIQIKNHKISLFPFCCLCPAPTSGVRLYVRRRWSMLGRSGSQKAKESESPEVRRPGSQKTSYISCLPSCMFFFFQLQLNSVILYPYISLYVYIHVPV